MHRRFVSRLALAVLAFAVCTAAQAQLFRAYLDSNGSDANPCTLPAPCRLLPAALAAVASGGEIWMLDSANFNTATFVVNKSVTILAVPGAVGSVVGISGPAISIATPGLNIALRNLAIVPFTGTVADGVSMTANSQLTIDQCVIANHGNNAVSVVGPGRVRIVRSIVRDNFSFALLVQNGATGEISDSQLLANKTGGVFATGTIASAATATVTDSNISGTGINSNTFGVLATATAPGAVARIAVVRSTIEGVTYPLDSETFAAAATAIVSVNASTLNANFYGWFVSGPGATIRTYGNNQISEFTSVTGALTTTALQ